MWEALGPGLLGLCLERALFTVLFILLTFIGPTNLFHWSESNLSFPKLQKLNGSSNQCTFHYRVLIVQPCVTFSQGLLKA